MSKIRILFVCHGNICRSPMAEFIMKDLIDRAGLSPFVEIDSAATSTEEIGNDIHPGTRDILDRYNITYTPRAARKVLLTDYQKYDFIIGMDSYNLSSLDRLFNCDPEGKVSLMLSWAGYDRDVADPWYTGDFEATYNDIEAGCIGLLNHLKMLFRAAKIQL